MAFSRFAWVAVAGAAALGAASCEPPKASPEGAFVFAVSGDHFERPPRGMMEGIVRARPAFVVSTGDLIHRSDPRKFPAFKKAILDPLEKIGAEFYPCVGNHDYPLDHWESFWGPRKGRPYYSFDHGDAHYVVLDCNRVQVAEGATPAPDSDDRFILKQGSEFQKGSEQYQWLIRDLEGTDKKYVFAFVHHCVVSFGGHVGDLRIQRELAPVFEKYRVSAVFTGHSHGYERFRPIRVDLSSGVPQLVLDESGGVVYVVTASGTEDGNLYEIKPTPYHAAFKKAANYIVVTVQGGTARGETFDPGSDTVIDRFELKPRR